MAEETKLVFGMTFERNSDTSPVTLSLTLFFGFLVIV